MKRSSPSRALLIAVGVAMAGCGAPPVLGTPTSSTTSPPTSMTTVSGAPTLPAQPVRVAVIVMENHGYDSVVGLPYIHSIASTATALTNYHASAHPSLPNYLALTSGTTWGISDDSYHVLPAQDIGDQLSAAGVPWRAYMEGMGANCRQGNADYAVKHDPFAYYGGRCPSSVVPFAQLGGDLGGTAAPRFIWITPRLCNDMHDCAPSVGDAWLQRTVPALLASPSMANGVLFITWDEDDGGGSNHVLSLVLGARRPASPATAYSHPSLLATVEDLLGLPRLPATQGEAAIGLR